MTVLAAVAHEGAVWIGADSRVVSSGTVLTTALPKLVQPIPDLVIGVSGSIRMLNLLGQALRLPRRRRGESAPAYIMVTVARAIRDLLYDHGALGTDEDNYPTNTNSYLLVGYRGVLYTCGSDLGWTQHAESYAANGSGGVYALGVLHDTQNVADPEQRVRRAVLAACAHDMWCAPPVTVLGPVACEVPPGRGRRQDDAHPAGTDSPTPSRKHESATGTSRRERATRSCQWRVKVRRSVADESATGEGG